MNPNNCIHNSTEAATTSLRHSLASIMTDLVNKRRARSKNSNQALLKTQSSGIKFSRPYKKGLEIASNQHKLSTRPEVSKQAGIIVKVMSGKIGGIDKSERGETNDSKTILC